MPLPRRLAETTTASSIASNPPRWTSVGKISNENVPTGLPRSKAM